MGNLVNLSQAIVDVLDDIQQDGGNAFADIQDWPTTNFAGTPAATVVPSDNDSDYATNVQNLRTYVYYVDLYYPIETEGDGAKIAFMQMRQMLDTCLDAFDQSDLLNNTCQLLRPAPSSWSIVQSSMGTLLSARITLDCRITVITNNG
jgi:hypothetical protein